MYDSKRFECSNSSQKVQILLKKLGEIRESSSYREKFIQGTDKFVQPNEMFELPSIPVTESQLYTIFPSYIIFRQNIQYYNTILQIV